MAPALQMSEDKAETNVSATKLAAGHALQLLESERDVQPQVLMSPRNDRHEMVLPISGGTFLSRRGESFPLNLQRSEFVTYLSANPHLLEIIETGVETGAASRDGHAWQESPLVCVDEADANQTVRDVAAFIQDTVTATRSMSRKEAEYIYIYIYNSPEVRTNNKLAT